MNRRDFLKNSTALSMSLAMTAGAVEIVAAADAKDDDKPKGPPINCAVIGLGDRGREMLTAMAKLGPGSAPVVKICDTYTAAGFVNRSKKIVPTAEFVDDYRKALDDKQVQAVFIATPSHLHKQIALDALAAGKHVYCETPLASSIEDAKAIAQAAVAAKPMFQSGLQLRSNMQYLHVLKFIRSSVLGDVAGGRAQFHKKNAWHRLGPTDERNKEMNWRLHKETSSGLLGEEGIYLIDTASWYFKALPLSVTAFGQQVNYKGGEEGMELPNTVQAVVEYPNNLHYMVDLTLVNSFDDVYSTFLGSECALMLRDQRAWMFKETDSTLLGWEVFARKDDMSIGDAAAGSGVKIATGIALVADATKQLALGKQPGQVGTDVSHTSLYQALDTFLNSIRQDKKPECGALEGYQATVVANKANEAVMTGNKIVFDKSWFTL
jgi:predicted dehydrogenase